MRTVSVRGRVTAPVPRQSGHFSSTTVPTPWHSRHGSENWNAPWFVVTSPMPLHFGQGRGSVPGLAPEPWQVSHRPGARSVSGRVAPRTASSKPSDSSASTSRPRTGPLRTRLAPPPPVNSEPNRSVNPPPNRRSPVLVVGAPPPNRSPRSNGTLLPPPPRALRRRAPLPNSERMSSYSLRLPGSDSTAYASETSLNFVSAFLSFGFRSGCSSRASLR